MPSCSFAVHPNVFKAEFFHCWMLLWRWQIDHNYVLNNKHFVCTSNLLVICMRYHTVNYSHTKREKKTETLLVHDAITSICTVNIHIYSQSIILNVAIVYNIIHVCDQCIANVNSGEFNICIYILIGAWIVCANDRTLRLCALCHTTSSKPANILQNESTLHKYINESMEMNEHRTLELYTHTLFDRCGLSTGTWVQRMCHV